MSVLIKSMWGTWVTLAPWFLLGVLISTILFLFFPKGFLARQLSGKLGVLKAVALGIPLPLCSCGVIPAAVGLHEEGVRRSSVMGFLISTPQTGLDSMSVSAAFLGWPFAIAKVFAALFMGLAGGLLEWIFESGNSPNVSSPKVSKKFKQERPTLKEAWLHTKMTVESIYQWILIGVAASALIQVLIPQEALSTFGSDNLLWTMILTLLFSLPIYVCATASVPIAAALVHAGLPPAAAWIFLLAGPASNVSTVFAVRKLLGFGGLLRYLCTIAILSMGLGFVLNDQIAIPHHMVAHSHAGHENFLSILSGILLAGLCLWFMTSDMLSWLKKKTESTPYSNDYSNEPKKEYSIQGMTCEGCAKNVKNAICKLTDVKSANVDLKLKRVMVIGDIPEEDIIRAVESAGYSASSL